MKYWGLQTIIWIGWAWKWIFQSQSGCEMITPANVLTATTWATLNHGAKLMLNWFLIHRLWENVCCFKPLGLGIVCYITLFISLHASKFPSGIILASEELSLTFLILQVFWHWILSAFVCLKVFILPLFWKIYLLSTESCVDFLKISLKMSLYCFHEYSALILIFVPLDVFFLWLLLIFPFSVVWPWCV